jgi:integrase/recombinase XerD
MQIPTVIVYVRHSGDCPDKDKGEAFRGCRCRKHIRWWKNGRIFRRSAKSRSWTGAEKVRAQIEAGFAGDPTVPVLGVTAEKRPAVADAIKTFLKSKESENVSASTIRKIKYQLGLFEAFFAKQSKFCLDEITPEDLIDFRASWKWGDLTRIKAQQTLRGFIRAACKGAHRTDLLDALGTIRETRQGREQRKPKPFTEAELNTLLAQVPVTFKDEPEKITRHQTMIRAMVSTGLAIIDTVQLQRSVVERAAKTGVVEIERQKTGKSAMIPVDSELIEELTAVLNGNPRYVFWHGKALADSETKRLQGEMRDLMRDAGLYIQGNVFHRFRDTAVDFWLGQGWSLTDVATALGDTLTIVEKHYKDWASQRMKERLAKLPVRKWER